MADRVRNISKLTMGAKWRGMRRRGNPCDGFEDSTNSEYLIVEAWLSSGITDLRRNSNSVNRHLIKAAFEFGKKGLRINGLGLLKLDEEVINLVLQVSSLRSLFFLLRFFILCAFFLHLASLLVVGIVLNEEGLIFLLFLVERSIHAFGIEFRRDVRSSLLLLLHLELQVSLPDADYLLLQLLHCFQLAD